MLDGLKENEKIEIVLPEIKNYADGEFFIALRFWKRCKKNGIPGDDWRKRTPAQLRVCEIFDILDAKRRA